MWKCKINDKTRYHDTSEITSMTETFDVMKHSLKALQQWRQCFHSSIFTSSESFEPHRENTLVTDSLNKQTCSAEAQLYLKYTDWHEELIQNDESHNKQTNKQKKMGADSTKHPSKTKRQAYLKAIWKPQRVRQACCCVPVRPSSTHSWDNKRRTNLQIINISSRLCFMYAAKGQRDSVV